MISAGIRELKDNLSRYVRRIEAGERIRVTAHGRVRRGGAGGVALRRIERAAGCIV
jgi:hypothetical protein